MESWQRCLVSWVCVREFHTYLACAMRNFLYVHLETLGRRRAIRPGGRLAPCVYLFVHDDRLPVIPKRSAVF